MRGSSIWSPTASASSAAAPACRRTTAHPASPVTAFGLACAERYAPRLAHSARHRLSHGGCRAGAGRANIADMLNVEKLRVAFPTRSGLVDAVRGVSLTRRPGEAGHRRRERLGQIDRRPGGHGLAAAAGHGHRRPAPASRTSTCCRATRAQWRELRGGRIGMVLQDPKYSLNPVMRVGDADRGKPARSSGLRGRAARRQVRDLLTAVRIRDPERVAAAWPHELSGGMGQRVMIAMMLAGEPDLLIADEPTSALDVTVQLQVLAILDDLVSERGMGLIFISHDLELVATFCDRVAIMYAGRIVEVCRRPTCMRPSIPTRAACWAACPGSADPQQRLPVLTRDPAWLEDAALIQLDELAVTFGEGAKAVRAVDRVSFTVAQGRGVRPGRRKRLGQEHGAAGHRRPDHRLDGQDPAGRPALGRARPARRRRKLQMVFQDPYGSLHPRHTVDRILSEPCRIHGLDRRRQAGRGGAGRGRAGPALPLPLPASALRRPAPAGRHRPCADPRARDRAARRADLGARRLGPGRDPEPAGRPAPPAWPDLPVRLAQPGRRRPCLRRARGDAPGPDRRSGNRRRPRRRHARAPLQPPAAGQQQGLQPRGRAATASGHG